VLDGTGEHASGVLGVGFAVDLERFSQGVCCIVGLVKVLGLNGGSLFEGKTSFLVCVFGNELELVDPRQGEIIGLLCFCTRKAFAACV
jgi:hypothetical protein